VIFSCDKSQMEESPIKIMILGSLHWQRFLNRPTNMLIKNCCLFSDLLQLMRKYDVFT